MNRRRREPRSVGPVSSGCALVESQWTAAGSGFRRDRPGGADADSERRLSLAGMQCRLLQCSVFAGLVPAEAQLTATHKAIKCFVAV
jgi:hypothetical protein